MRTTVTQRGQTVIPAEIRRRYQIEEGSHIEWIDTGTGVKVVPVPVDPITALRGIGKGEGLGERLLTERRIDRERE